MHASANGAESNAMIARKPIDNEDPVSPSANHGASAGKTSGPDRFSWDNMRLFLAVAEAGSFRSAATVAGVSINTIRSKVDRLERQIGGPLLRRSVEGVALTQDGRELVQIAREMREMTRTTARVAVVAASRPERIRVVATEGIGTAWIVPRLAGLQAAQPDIRVSLTCEVNPATVLFRDVDLAIQLHKPTDPALKFERVGTMHVVPFVSRSYVATHGLPRSLAEAKDHYLVWQQLPPLAADLLPPFLDEAAREMVIAVETNTSTAHYWAVANGAGIGFLPTYVCAMNADLIAIDLGLAFQHDIFVVYHANADKNQQITVVRDWLRHAFDSDVYPCFAEALVDPATIKPVPGDPVAHLLGPKA